jgi:hypothetical protein
MFNYSRCYVIGWLYAQRDLHLRVVSLANGADSVRLLALCIPTSAQHMPPKALQENLPNNGDMVVGSLEVLVRQVAETIRL